jgi:DNA-binding NarL/FixJ family response regulator
MGGLGGEVAVVSVVLADDVEDIRFVFRIVLECGGRFKVVGEATNGVEAVEITGALRPDVLLLDVGMPEMGGLEALPLLRRVSPDTKVVVVSGYGALAERAALDGGAAAFVTKGDDTQRLVEAVTEAVDRTG